MQKIQVLFPEPQMRRLRAMAHREDRSLSELIRRATERWLDSAPTDVEDANKHPQLPVFHGGAVLTSAEHLRDKAYGDLTHETKDGHA
ncbi:MAG: hypothetical protein C0404_02040 [Verrucomicrobia bacterium]|nr:hypothetical protein [Verrucomicrobiota bacterium]